MVGVGSGQELAQLIEPLTCMKAWIQFPALKAGGSGVQSHPWIHSEFEARLGWDYFRKLKRKAKCGSEQ